MTPYERAELWHNALGSTWSFADVIKAHGKCGFIHSTPEVFVMARRIFASDQDTANDLTFWNPTGNCWHVWLLAGNPRAAWRYLPFDLPFVSFHRRGILRVLPLEDAKRMLHP